MLPRLKIYSAKARLRELKAEMLENRLREQEEKLDVAAAMGWHDEAEDEADENAKYVLVPILLCVFSFLQQEGWGSHWLIAMSHSLCVMRSSTKQTIQQSKHPGHPNSVLSSSLSPTGDADHTLDETVKVRVVKVHLL